MTFTNFSEQISPFPDAGNILLYDDHKPQKLQPIRSNNCGDESSSPTQDTQMHEDSIEIDSNSNSKGPLWNMVLKTLEEMGYYKKNNQNLGPNMELQESPTMGVEKQMSFHQHTAPSDAVDIANMLVALHNEGEEKLCNVENPTFESDEKKETCVKRKSSDNKNSSKLEVFLLNMVEKVLKKQDEMHNRFMEIIHKYDQDRIAREEAWRRQEVERCDRDKKMRDEQTTRSLALISFIENILGQKIYVPQTLLQPITPLQPIRKKQKCADREECKLEPNTKRWPEEEVKALISIRTAVDHNLQRGEFKHSTWEEVSQAMSALGYIRTANKCKEKWENINKYFRKTIERGQRPKSGKTCPYFQDLCALYQNQKPDLVSTPIPTIADGIGIDQEDLKVCNIQSVPVTLQLENGPV